MRIFLEIRLVRRCPTVRSSANQQPPRNFSGQDGPSLSSVCARRGVVRGIATSRGATQRRSPRRDPRDASRDIARRAPVASSARRPPAKSRRPRASASSSDNDERRPRGRPPRDDDGARVDCRARPATGPRGARPGASTRRASTIAVRAPRARARPRRPRSPRVAMASPGSSSSLGASFAAPRVAAPRAVSDPARSETDAPDDDGARFEQHGKTHVFDLPELVPSSREDRFDLVVVGSAPRASPPPTAHPPGVYASRSSTLARWKPGATITACGSTSSKSSTSPTASIRCGRRRASSSTTTGPGIN